MTIRGITSAVALMIGLVRVSAANIPSVATSSCPSHIDLVGRSVAGPDTTIGDFDIVTRDLAGNPWTDGSVVIDLARCPDCRLDTASLAGSSAPATCPFRSAAFAPGADGHTRFCVVGGSTGGPGTQGPSEARIFGGGALLRVIPVAIYDLDGSGGLGTGDLSLWLDDFGRGVYIGRSDYDGDGAVSSNDLSLWLTAFGLGGSSESGASLCP